MSDTSRVIITGLALIIGFMAIVSGSVPAAIFAGALLISEEISALKDTK